MQADVEYDELDKSLAAHERANRARLADGKSAEFCSRETSKEFRKECHDTDQDDVTPCFSRVKQTEICPQTRQCEVLRASDELVYSFDKITAYQGQENERYEIFKFLNERDGETTLMRNNQAREKATYVKVIRCQT